MVIKYLCGSLSKMKAPLEHTELLRAANKTTESKSDADKKTVYYRNVMKVEIRWREISSGTILQPSLTHSANISLPAVLFIFHAYKTNFTGVPTSNNISRWKLFSLALAHIIHSALCQKIIERQGERTGGEMKISYAHSWYQMHTSTILLWFFMIKCCRVYIFLANCCSIKIACRFSHKIQQG